MFVTSFWPKPKTPPNVHIHATLEAREAPSFGYRIVITFEDDSSVGQVGEISAESEEIAASAVLYKIIDMLGEELANMRSKK